ncbi:hypothetical protein M2451_004021 [Dysgonomonas sp. PFB1-18]|uniref:hypothetical protein n=1 Tax=unclassified Dysgonomonas TaxID=2630389 RepID=UPI0024768B8E|nr:MULTISPECIES: hypothetical protein [unclassified Dysgonomonas]MDH6310473.1 hypothetical protein [Dysgonomonas sp. PF1-14]MDH6340911.1 hypothetical protein [Dysgonomonas sp. PF1-16]MDH6382674.1 hypothetical protein [Dysgonomonas sp. PFB1-18]MDH6399894.1 hypothetical protein [Dysgonomonas sp. PF1-23]
MKKIAVLSLFILITSNIFSTEIPLKEIKESVLSFLQKNGDCPEFYTLDNFPNEMITNPLNKNTIKEKEHGIYLIKNFLVHGYLHYLLVDNNGFSIIDMRESPQVNIVILLHFLEENENYTKNDVLFYIRNFVDTSERNEKNINRNSVIIND